MKPYVCVRRAAVAAIALAAAAGGAVWFFTRGGYAFMTLCIMAAGWAMATLFRLYSASVRKAAFMLDAIESDDFSLSFTSDGRVADDAPLNEALNRIRDMMKHARRQAVERDKYYELIMDSVRTGIITVNERGSVYQANAEALRIFRLPVFTHIDQLNRIEPAIRDAIANLEVGEKAQVSFRDEHGEVSVSLVASRIPLGDQTLKIVVIADINSELAEKELEAWIRLTRVLTHEIMNSLAPITSLSDALIGMSGGQDGKIAEGLRIINSTGKSLVSFVESYRKFTFVPAPVRKLFAVRPLLERVAALASQQWEGAVEWTVEPDDMFLHADEDLVGQVVGNILRNAIQAAGTAGRVWIGARIDAHENIVVEIGNDGGAIPAAIAENIFIPFFTTRENGSGVGLSISRQIMRLHGGSLRLTSNADGRVIFTLLFTGARAACL
jgi:nitrogen fixation/metabolism regulation signal transduction histidine kinase